MANDVDRKEQDAQDAMCLVPFEAAADAWAEEVNLTAMIKNAVSPMRLNRNAPDDVREQFTARMEQQIDAIVKQAFIEATVRYDLRINTPETEDFMKAVPLEAAHQVERWGRDHDARKTPWDWYWTLGYLGGKCAHALLAGDIKKAKHHTITIAALALNWHRGLKER